MDLFTAANRDARLVPQDRRVLWECLAILSATEWRTIPDFRVGEHLEIDRSNVHRALRNLARCGYLHRRVVVPRDHRVGRQDWLYQLPATAARRAA